MQKVYLPKNQDFRSWQPCRSEWQLPAVEARPPGAPPDSLRCSNSGLYYLASDICWKGTHHHLPSIFLTIWGLSFHLFLVKLTPTTQGGAEGSEGLFIIISTPNQTLLGKGLSFLLTLSSILRVYHPGCSGDSCDIGVNPMSFWTALVAFPYSRPPLGR